MDPRIFLAAVFIVLLGFGDVTIKAHPAVDLGE